MTVDFATERVALILPSFGSGGAERVLLNLAKGFAAAGAEVRLVALDPDGPLRAEVAPDVEIVDLDRARVRWAAPTLVRHLRRRPATLVIGSQTHLNVLLGLLRPALPPQTHLVLREPNLLPEADTRRPTDRAIGRALRRADLLVASSTPMHDHLRLLTRGVARLVVLPNPVDVASLRDPLPRDDVTDAAAERTVPHLVTIGRLVPQKAHADLLRALAATSRPVTLDVIGTGPLEQELHLLTAQLGLLDRVRFHGRLDDRAQLARRLARADLLVQPARYDGMPNVVLEALAVGTPVLATTDLTVLADLATEVPPGALRLVPRADLGLAIDRSEAQPGPAPRPNLLPERFSIEAVVALLATALADTAERSDA